MSTKKRFLSSLLLAVLAILPLQSSANNIDASSARNVANTFLRQLTTSSKTFKSVSQSDLRLVHAEKSNVATNGNAYYAFNIEGGGWVIVAGEDRANQVLAYNDQGRLDFTNLPDNFKALMSSYKEEIEYLQLHPELAIKPAICSASGVVVEPLIKAIWGQELPYYLQCPVYHGEYCAVGCVATAMTQVMFYWKYPTSSPALNSYYCYSIGQTVPSLPATTFEYGKMITSYCHWDYEQSALIQDTYTDDQAQAVAKIARYCGQAVKMDYHPDGSGATVNDQLTAMKKFGFSSSAKSVSRSSWWSENYTTQQWEAMIKEELDARRPILYSADDVNGGGGHAFVCDGYDNNNMFHFNFGWYGTCDGWYKSTALNMIHRSGEELKFNSGHEMLTGVVPPTYCMVSADELTSTGELYILGEEMPIEAANVNIFTTYTNVNFLFSIYSNSGTKICTTPVSNVTIAGFDQGSNMSNIFTLPTTLEQGKYDITFNYYTGLPRNPSIVECDNGELNVIGHFAKFNAPFNIDDITRSIDFLLDGTHPGLTIDDVTVLIDAMLTSE